MRTAEEIMQDEFSECELKKLSDNSKRYIKDAINEARKEAIEECARVASVEDYEWPADYSYQDIGVDKQSILSLINELK